MKLLVITTARISLVREGEAEGELTFYINDKLHKFRGRRVKSIEKAHQAINGTKETFMANPANFEKIDPSKAVATVQDERSVTEQLNELKQLLYSRTITQEQYDTMKAKITGK